MDCEAADTVSPESPHAVSDIATPLTENTENETSASEVSNIHVSNIASPMTVVAGSTAASSVAEYAASYISPGDIVTLPKAAPRKTKNGSFRPKGKTQIYTLTPVRNEIAEREQNQAQKRNAKNLSQKEKCKNVTTRKRLFKQKLEKQQQIETSDEESDSIIQYADESDISLGLSDEEINANIEKFVILKVAGRQRTLKYIARVNEYDEDDDYEGVLLEKVLRRHGEKEIEMTFVVNEHFEYSFSAKHILAVLPLPMMLGGSMRRCRYLLFSFDFKDWDLAY